jgi:hypothetical protein
VKTLEDLERAFESGLTVWEKEVLKKRASVMGHKIVREVKRETKVITGNLRRRWFFRLEERSGEMVIVISNDADYAAAVNNGHRIVRARKTVGMAKGRHMLEKGIETYQSKYLKDDVEGMLQDLRQAIR